MRACMSSPPDRQETTRLLRAIGSGQAAAAAQLLPLVYDELHRLAAQLMGRERKGHTLQATALLNEAFLRLCEPGAQCERRRYLQTTFCQHCHALLVKRFRTYFTLRDIPAACPSFPSAAQP